mmetsp:Transcript_349/g.968  ORF Transcript_349/g.968 Transcript_349/m.968 type:complete len:92 (-) Transcript_349:37-312(-)
MCGLGLEVDQTEAIQAGSRMLRHSLIAWVSTSAGAVGGINISVSTNSNRSHTSRLVPMNGSDLHERGSRHIEEEGERERQNLRGDAITEDF